MRFNKIFFSKTLAPVAIILMLMSIAGAAPFAYITNAVSNNISVIDTETNTVVAIVPNLNNAWGVAVNHNETTAYVTDRYGDNVSVIDTKTNTVTATIKVGNEPCGVAINPTDTRVYVTNIASDNVSVIDTTTNNVIARVNVGTEPSGVVVTPDGKKVYVASYNSGNISVIDTATNTVTDTVDAGAGSYGIAVTSDSAKVYVSNSDNDTGSSVSVIDANTNTITDTVIVGNNPSGIAITPDGKEVYVANFDDDTVSVIDTETNIVKATVPVGSYPEGVGVTPDGKTVYVANAGNDNVSVIDTATNTIKTTIPVGSWPIAFGQLIATHPVPEPVFPVANFTSNVTEGYAPLDVQFNDTSTETPTSWEWNFGDSSPNSTEQDPLHTFTDVGVYHVTLTVAKDGNNSSITKDITVNAPIGVGSFAYITNAVSNNISVIDTETNTVVTTVPNLNNAWGVAVSRNGRTAYVTDRYGDNVSVIDTKTNTVTATIKVGNEPCGVAINPTDTRVYVTNIASDNVSVIDTTTNNVIARVNVGTEPSGVVVTPDGKRVYVASYNSGNISVIDTATNTVTDTVDTGAGSYGIAVTSDSAKVYVSNSDNDTGSSVSVIDANTNTITDTVIVGNNPSGIAITPDGKEVYVANFDDDTVSVIDTETNIIRATVPVGSYPEGVGVTPDGKTVYVANAGNDNVSVIDTATNTIKTTIPVGSWPIAFGQLIGSPTLTPTLTLVKSASPITYSTVGESVTYTYNVTNTGNVITTGPITVTDNKVGTITITSGDLTPRQTVIGTATYTITQSDLDAGSVTNEAFATGNFNGAEVKSNNDTATITATVQGPAYTIDKKVIDVNGEGPSGIVTEAGDTITYQIDLTNTGTVDLTGIILDDSLITLTAPIESLNSDGILEVEETWTYKGTYTVTIKDIYSNGGGDGFIENTATVDCVQLDAKSDSAQVSIQKKPVENDPSCIIDKTVIDISGKGPTGIVKEAGDVITYKISVLNDGNVDLTNVIVSDILIEKLTGPFESINPDGVFEVDEIWTYTGTYTVTQEDIENNANENEFGNIFIENIATFDCDQLDLISDYSEVLIEKEYEEEEKPAYCLSKSIISVDENGDCIVNEPGDVIKYRVIVKNEGNVDLTGVSVEDTLVDLTGPRGDEIDPGILNVGETWKLFGEYTVTQQDIDSNGNGDGFIENTATVSCNELPYQKCIAKQPILQKTDLCIYKSVIGIDETGDCIINKPGEIIQYQVVIKNEGKVDLTEISVKDSLIELVGPIGDEITPGILNPGEIWKYTGNYAVTEHDIDSNGNGDGYIENTATVSCSELPDQTNIAKQQIFLIPINYEDNESELDMEGTGNNSENKNTDNNTNNENNGGNSNSGNSQRISGGSSGGISTSPEPAKNVETKETAQEFITNGKNVEFDFKNNKTCVAYISFDAKKTLEKTKATVEMLKTKSSLVSELPADEVYKYLNIWIGNKGVVAPENIENAIICFKVEKQYIEDKEIDTSSIILNRYNDGKWDNLPTSISEEDDKYLYLTAKTPGFSPFAITAKTIKENTQNENEDEKQKGKENKINIEPKTNDLEQKNANTKENNEKQQKENMSVPGFNAMFAVAAILVSITYKKNKKN